MSAPFRYPCGSPERRRMENYIDHIYNEDCIAGMARIPDHSVDMILTDLPYGVTDCRWDSILPFDQLWAQYLRVIKERGCYLPDSLPAIYNTPYFQPAKAIPVLLVLGEELFHWFYLCQAPTFALYRGGVRVL